MSRGEGFILPELGSDWVLVLNALSQLVSCMLYTVVDHGVRAKSRASGIEGPASLACPLKEGLGWVRQLAYLPARRGVRIQDGSV